MVAKDAQRENGALLLASTRKPGVTTAVLESMEEQISGVPIRRRHALSARQASTWKLWVELGAPCARSVQQDTTRMAI